MPAEIEITKDMRDEKAMFKAYREILGYSITDIAEDLHVSRESIKRWENPAYSHMPNPEAWDFVEAKLKTMLDQVDYMLDVVEKHPGIPVQLPYYRTQAHYDQQGRDEGRYTFVNATSRLTAAALMLEGREVSFTYEPARGLNITRKH